MRPRAPSQPCLRYLQLHRASPLARPVFHEAPPLTDQDVVELTAALHRRILRYLQRRGRIPRSEHDDSDPPEPDEPLFAQLCAALGRRVAWRSGRRAVEQSSGWVVVKLTRVPASSRASCAATSSISPCTPKSGSPPTIATGSSACAAMWLVPHSGPTGSRSTPTAAWSTRSPALARRHVGGRVRAARLHCPAGGLGAAAESAFADLPRRPRPRRQMARRHRAGREH